MIIGTIYRRYPLYLNGSYLQEFLNKLAHSVDSIYLISSHYPKGNFGKEDNIKIFWVPLIKISHIDQIVFAFASLFRVIFTKNLKRIDLINSIGIEGLLAGVYLKKRFNIPVVCTIELLNEKGSFFSNIYYVIVKYLLTRMPIDKFICWSNYFWEKHLKTWGITKDKVSVVPAGINIQKYNSSIDGTKIKNRYAPDMPLIIFAKPLYRENTEAAKVLVCSIARLSSIRKVKLVIGGGKGVAEVKLLAEKLGIENLVDFMPPTKFTDIPNYIAASDLVVLPFTYAPTTSRSLLEAMAIGKPIITICAGEVYNVLEDRKNVLFTELNPKDISEAIDELLNNKELCCKIGKNAEALVREKFSLDFVIKHTVDIFKRLCSI